LRNSVRSLDVSIDEAARMASTYAAEFLGLAHERGRIAPGMRADFVELDADLAVHRTWIGAKTFDD